MRRKESCGKWRPRVLAASWLEAVKIDASWNTASWLKVLAVDSAAKKSGGDG
jgi:hypothetical protein